MLDLHGFEQTPVTIFVNTVANFQLSFNAGISWPSKYALASHLW
jgi:hypothetical protein